MKIIDKINAEAELVERVDAEIALAHKTGADPPAAKAPYFSFEFFPPKTEAGTENLYLRMDRMTSLQPIFIDVTWGAGGSTKDLTMAISQYSQTYFGVEVLMHLTCTNLTVDALKEILNAARAAGIQNILALRGDPPKGAFRWKKTPGGLEHAIDLVRLIREEHGDYFGIAVAGFPEGHPNSGNSISESPSPQKGKRSIKEETLTEEEKNTAREELDAQLDIEVGMLKEKVAAGADFVLTQFFYDPEVFLSFQTRCRSAGISCPIIPGIMPIQGYNSFEKMTTFCRTRVPAKVWSDMADFRENDEEVKAYGVRLCRNICRTLQKAGVHGFHFYTLNLEKSVVLILEGLRVKDQAAARRALPWRGSRQQGRSISSNSLSGSSGTLSSLSCGNGSGSNLVAQAVSSSFGGGLGVGGMGAVRTYSSSSSMGVQSMQQNNNNNTNTNSSNNNKQVSSPPRPERSRGNTEDGTASDSDSGFPNNRGDEDVRPINWANRPKSYIKRTVTWDEFPNGRWGDNRSPAFGELSDSHFYRPSEGSKEDRLAMWGEGPIVPEEIYEVFAQYVEGKIPILPWCESATQEETNIISQQLASFNRAGFLTINSQPAVNGAKSSDAVFGWGGVGGRVYQKAYIEFFTSPELLKIIMEIVRARPDLNAHAVNKDGEMFTSGPKGVTALTWGAFPNKEILQPTVFDSDTFVVWSEEAFQLWTAAWAELYDDETDSSALLYEIHDTYFLVAIIDNEYIESDLYSVFTEALVEQSRQMQERKKKEKEESYDDSF